MRLFRLSAQLHVYAGALIMLPATPIAMGSWCGVLAFAPLLIVIVWRLRDEERFLLEQLPGCAEYLRLTYLLAPPLWRIAGSNPAAVACSRLRCLSTIRKPRFGRSVIFGAGTVS